MKVRCNWCYWEGDEDDLLVDEDGTEYCPDCGKSGYLMDMTDEEEDEAELECMRHGFSLRRR